ncbi:hypothetical protein [Nocardioides xinjiangensis]|uniref:hypothetical protein n=1 Tax=Nocardioides xinjiangensis TaxID=2817376 RepID=UPI001B31387C|nr:hypothetical protein [Nocardioides sp. SYSU D00514]
MITLVLAVGFAVVGIAGAANAHHNTITGSVACKDGGGWAVTWTVVNSEPISETITYSSRGVVPAGTTLSGHQTRTFTETVTTKPTEPLTLRLTAKWDNGYTRTNSGSVAVAKFTDKCDVKIVEPPTVPVLDPCGPNNATYGPVPSGPWTYVINGNGSITITANPGHQFPGGTTTVTLPPPSDSNVPCPVTPPVNPPVNPPVLTPPVVVPPEVLPAQVRVVRAQARKIDKCGRSGDRFRVAERSGVIYKSRGKVLREGRWLRATTRSITVRAYAADATFRLEGKQVWRMTFSTRPCASAPEIAPNTGM